MTLVAPQPLTVLHGALRDGLPLLALVALACDGADCVARNEPPPTTPSYIDVVPQRVLVSPGQTFVMRVRVLNQYRATLRAEQVAPGLIWSTDPGSSSTTPHLVVISIGADSIVVQAAAPAEGTLSQTKLTATIGVLSGSADILIGPGAEPDTVFTDYRQKTAPDVVLIDDTLPPTDMNDLLVAFVATGPIGDFKTGAGELARFSTDQRFTLHPVTFTPTSDRIDLRTGATGLAVTRPFTPTIAIWFASNDPDASSQISDDLDRVESIFSKHRTGLSLQASPKRATNSGSYLLDAQAPAYTCPELTQHLTALGVPTPPHAADSLRVVYVDQILIPGSGSQPASPSGWSGFTCPWDADAGTVVLISLTDEAVSTLAHELGHAFGLLAPNWGHTDNNPGFSHSNIMWHTDEDVSTAPRSGLSLGQVFRMNVDQGSWIFRTGLPQSGSRTCDPLDVGRACPALAKEIVPLPPP